VCVPILFLFLAGGVTVAEPLPHFRAHTIAGDLSGGYQVLAVDMNKDGRKDLIALGTGMKDLVWFENPGWRRHVIATGMNRMINLAPIHSGVNGIPDLVLATDFSMEPAKSVGRIWVLKHKGDPRELWSVEQIDQLPTSHRMRRARLADGGTAVINAPLAGAKALPPDYRENVPVVFYRPGSWKRELLNQSLEGVLHGIAVTDWDGNGRDALLTASFEGIHLFRQNGDGGWSGKQVARGNPDPWPRCGASDISVGRLGSQRFVCTIEPWHGNQVVVYQERDGNWRRSVIDDALAHGHALITADLNGDGLDEIIAGCREGARSVNIYSASGGRTAEWTRTILDDGGMPGAACDVADLNGDGRPDIVCIGGNSLKWYENLGPPGV